MRAVLCLLALIVATGAARAGEVAIEVNNSPYGDALIREAVDIFRQNCRPLGGMMWDDLDAVHVEVKPEYADHRLAKGWKHTIFIRATVPDAPRVVPATRPDIGVIAGQTLHYAIGGGKKPGYFSTKTSSNYLCGIRDYDTGDDRFVPVEALKILR